MCSDARHPGRADRWGAPPTCPAENHIRCRIMSGVADRVTGQLVAAGAAGDVTEAWLANRRLSAHTRAAYRGDVAGWLAWCAGRGLDPLRAMFLHVNEYARALESTVETRTGRPLSAGDGRPQAVRAVQLVHVPGQAGRGAGQPGRRRRPAAGGPRPLRHRRADRRRRSTRCWPRPRRATGPTAARTRAVAGAAGRPGAAGRRAGLAGLRRPGLRARPPQRAVRRQGRPAAPAGADPGHGRGAGRLPGRAGRGRRAPPDADRAAAGHRQRPAAGPARRVPAGAPAGPGRRHRRPGRGCRRTRCGTRSPPTARAEGVPLEDVQDAMGHADPRTTRRYDRDRHNLDRDPSYAIWAARARRVGGGSCSPPGDPAGGSRQRLSPTRPSSHRAYCHLSGSSPPPTLR